MVILVSGGVFDVFDTEGAAADADDGVGETGALGWMGKLVLQVVGIHFINSAFALMSRLCRADVYL